MDEKRNWKYCVVGNIVKQHYDEKGILRYGTPAFVGGAKVFLCGKLWAFSQREISVLGLSRGKHYQVHEVPVELIENIRCQKTYRPTVLDIMSNWEFEDLWWGNTSEDRQSVTAFVDKWHEMRGAK